MVDIINTNKRNENFTLLNDYFDEIFEYAMMTELFTSDDDSDEV